METRPQSIIYLLCIDHGLLICNRIDDQHILPCLKIEKLLPDQQSVRSYFSAMHKVRIDKDDILPLFPKRGEDPIVFAVIIDLNKDNNASLVKFIPSPRALTLASVLRVKWDLLSDYVITKLANHPKYAEPFFFIRKGFRFVCLTEAGAAECDALFLPKITNIWQYERPDVIVETAEDKMMIGIECFQFDASLHGKRGSEGYITKKEMEKSLLDAGPEASKTVSRKISNNLSNWWQDFVAQFEKHNKTKEYLDHMAKIHPNDKNTLGFFADDVTVLGSRFYENESARPLYPFHIKEFWDLFNSNADLSFFLFRQAMSETEEVFFVTKKDFEELVKKGYIHNIDDIEGVFMENPVLIGATFEFPAKD